MYICGVNSAEFRKKPLTEKLLFIQERKGYLTLCKEAQTFSGAHPPSGSETTNQVQTIQVGTQAKAERSPEFTSGAWRG